MNTVAQTARRLGVSQSFIRKLIVQRRIEFVRIGRCLRIPQDAIEGLVAAGSSKNSSVNGEGR
jgi:excisionase family DNA binding protein